MHKNSNFLEVMTNTIDTSLLELRSNLSSLIEQAHYTDTQIRLTRHNKPIARIVGEKFMHSLEVLFSQDPGLQETLQVMLDADMLDQLRQSQQEIQQGKVRPLTDLLME